MSLTTPKQFVAALKEHKTLKAVSRATDTKWWKVHKLYKQALAEEMLSSLPEGAPSRETMTGQIKKPSKKAGGRIKIAKPTQIDVEPVNGVRRYLFTSAQNNTKLHPKFWENLKAYAGHVGARIVVSRFTYNKLHQHGMDKGEVGGVTGPRDMWWDKELLPYLVDERADIAPGLVWCGEMNIIPTAADPLTGLESYTGRASGIFPHVKCRMQSIPAGKYEPTKFNYTTGTVTARNYIMRKEGLKGQFHHVYGALIAEVDAGGNWYCRQINADSTGTFYDVANVGDGSMLRVKNGEVTQGDHRAEAATMGDIHVAQIDKDVKEVIWGEGGMIDMLRPKEQHLHDVFDGYAQNSHDVDNVHITFRKWIEKKTSMHQECVDVRDFFVDVNRPDTATVVIDSNHHHQIGRWLRRETGLRDPSNAEMWVQMHALVYAAIRANVAEPNYMRVAMEAIGEPAFEKKYGIKFLDEDESHIICEGAHGGIECGMHGDLGPNGSRGSPGRLARMGRKANTGHTHSAGIIDGIYTAGCCCILDPSYVRGPSSWSQTQIVTYPNAKRALLTIWANKWRA